MTYQTNNPVGSVDVRDLYDNAQAFDNFSAGPLDAYPDRFGVSRQSLQGIRNASQYVILGPYAAGLNFTAMNQVFSYLGELYAPGPSIVLPYTTTGVGAAEIANFRSVGDAILRSDLANAVDSAKGAAMVAYLGRTLAARLDEVVNIADMPNAVTGDNSPADRTRLIAKLDAAAAAGKTVIVPSRVWQFSDWIPLPDKLKMVFMPGAQWKLTAATALGGFVCGGYTAGLVPRPFADVEIFGIDLDCGNLPGENGFNALNGVNIKLHHPKVRNIRFSPTTQGGKAFQFEGATVDGVHVYSPYIENCTIGINSHADPLAGTEVARFITYYNVVMRNVDVPFNIDGQFLNPENGVVTNMSTTVLGVNLFDCGKLTFPGAASTTGGGIVCGDRGYGLKISGLRLINTAAYGGIGAVVRGTMFNVSLNDFKIEAPSLTAVIDFTPVGYGSPSSGAHPCVVDASGITVLSNLDYIVKGYTNGKVGRCRFEVEIDSAVATLTGVCDAEATFNGLGVLKLSLANLLGYNTGLRTLVSLYADGNSTALCFPEYQEGTWTPVDASGAGLAFVVSGTCRYVRQGRLVTAFARFDYPATADTALAKIGGLPFTAANFSTMAGAVSIAYTTEPTLAAGYIVGASNTIQPSTASGVAPTNATLSGDSIYMTATYLC